MAGKVLSIEDWGEEDGETCVRRNIELQCIPSYDVTMFGLM